MIKKDRKKALRRWRIIKFFLEIIFIAIIIAGIILFCKTLFGTNVIIPVISLVIVITSVELFSRVYYLFTFSEYLAIE